MRLRVLALLCTACAAPEPSEKRPTTPTLADSASPGTTPSTGAVAQLRSLAEARGWRVSDGRFVFSTMEYCCQAGVNCLGNNPTTPYGMVALPPAPGQTVPDADNFWMWGPVGEPGLSRSFRMRADEAIVVLGQAPPRHKYMSLRSGIATRLDVVSGKRDYLVASMGPTTNHLTLPEGFWGSALAITTTADAVSEYTVDNWLETLGYREDQRHSDRISAADVRFGLEQDNDTLMVATRLAVPDDPEAAASYLAEPPLAVLRLTPPDETVPFPFDRQPFPPRGSGEDESAWAGALDDLETAILERFPTLEDQPAVPNFAEAFTCIEDQTCIGDVWDRMAARTAPMLLGEDEVMVVYGVNHERTGRASYSNFALMVNDNWVGAAAVDSAQMVGSARSWLGDAHPQVDDLYAWILARDCSPYAEPCLEVAQTCPWPALNATLFITFRMYLDPVTGAAPLESELLIDRVRKGTP